MFCVILYLFIATILYKCKSNEGKWFFWQILIAKIMKEIILAKHHTVTIIIINAKKLFWELEKILANQA